MLKYPTDLTGGQYDAMLRIIRDKRKRKHSLRGVLNAIFYLVKSGCQWRMIPTDFPKRGRVPMRTGNGYVVISAIRPKYRTEIETVVIPRSVYQLRITFGHKIIYFDPKDGNSPSSRTIAGVEMVLRKREDLADVEEVIVQFRAAADELLRRIEADGYMVRR